MHDGTFGNFKTSRRERVDIRVGVERRRRWSREEKLRIVRESLKPNAVVIAVARRNEVSPSLIYVWRRQALAGLLEGFHRVEVVSETRSHGFADPLPLIEADAGSRGASESKPPAMLDATPAERPAPPSASSPSIEITMPDGTIVRVGGEADAKALRTVLGALVKR